MGSNVPKTRIECRYLGSYVVGIKCRWYQLSPHRLVYCNPAPPSLYLQMSEDCLTVNVYRPKYDLQDPAFRGFPVIVYIHGGDFSTGTAGAKVYDGDVLVSQGNVIVVTFNYRLGMLYVMSCHIMSCQFMY